MYQDDPRYGYPESDTHDITAGDGNAPQTVIDVPSDALFVPTQIVIDYDNSATANTTITLNDDADGTTAGSLGDTRMTFRDVVPGEVRTIDEIDARDFEEDVLVQTDGNQDGTVSVFIAGRQLTALKDMRV